MTQTPCISIICPIYKAEKYLETCIDSVISQSFDKWELILVDDGSPDSSGTICDKYSKLDSRIKVFHKANEGVSIARQFGLDHATGEYVIHIDPDDWIEKDMLHDIYAYAKENDSEMVIFDFYKENSTGTYHISQKPSNLTANGILNSFFHGLHGSTCNKLVKLKNIRKYNIKFPNTFNFCEDLYFNCQLLLKISRITYIPKAYYHYNTTINDNSLVSKYSFKIQKEDFVMYNAFCSLLKQSTTLQRCRIKLASTIIARAFYGNIDSSHTFFEKYNKYVFLMLRNQQESIFMRFLFFISCIGGYKMSLSIFHFKNKIKEAIKNKKCIL